MPRAFIAIDLGATSGRVMLSRLEKGRLTLDELHRFPNQPISSNGELHWDIAGIWREIRAGLDAAAASADPIESIGVDSWGVDYALLGRDGLLLEDPYHYRDARTDGILEQVCSLVGAAKIYQRTGVQLLPINTLYQLCAAQRRTPQLLAAAEHLLMIPDLVNYRLTGVKACEFTIASTSQMLSHETGEWDRDLLAGLGLPTRFLTPIVAPGTILGPLTRGIGISLSGPLVVAGACHDTASAVASVRASGDTAFLSSGTWSLLGTEVSKPIVSERSRELNFTNEGGVCGTTRLLKNITGLWLLEGCRRQWAAENRDCSWDDLLAQAASATPVRTLIDPDDQLFVRPRDMAAAIDEFCRRTDQPAPRTCGEYARAILEGLALKYRFVLDQLQEIAGTKLTAIRVIGGGARNALLNQFTADATGRLVLAGPAEATALGNTAMQMLACGVVQSLDAARDLIETSQPPGRFEPMASAYWDAARERFRGILEGCAARRVRGGANF